MALQELTSKMTDVANIDHRVKKAEESVRKAEVRRHLVLSPYSIDSGV